MPAKKQGKPVTTNHHHEITRKILGFFFWVLGYIFAHQKVGQDEGLNTNQKN